MAFKLEIKGLRELQLKMKSLPVTLQTEVKATVENGCKVFVRNAQRDAPVDVAVLKNGITYYPEENSKTKTSFILVSNAKYSPYLEWGTITKVKVPAGEQDYAILFKGKGIRKTGGISPHPFFFKQLPATKELIEKGIQAIINEEKL